MSKAPKRKKVVVMLPTRLYNQLDALLTERGLTFQTATETYLQSLLTQHGVYTLDDVFTFGKFRGSKVETVIRLDPGYVGWLLHNVEHFRLDSEAVYLLNQLLEE